MANFIGSRTRSKEGPRHVTGRGLYTDDFILPGMLQAMILRSPHAHAKILSVDAAPALTNANVVAVITPDDNKQRTKPFKPGRYAAGLKRPIDEYAGAPYQEVAAKARAHLDRLAALYATPARETELVAIFKEATRLETDFWEMGWRAAQRVE